MREKKQSKIWKKWQVMTKKTTMERERDSNKEGAKDRERER